MRHNILIISVLILLASKSVQAIDYIDMTIYTNDSLLIKFELPNTFECGINIINEPDHALISEILIESDINTVTYKYLSEIDYIGSDTLILIKGCMVEGNPENIIADTIEYRLEIIKPQSINTKLQARVQHCIDKILEYFKN